MATMGGGPVASPSDYYRVNLLDRLAASVRNERRAILASESPRAQLRPTISPGATPGVDGLPIYLGSKHVTPYLALKNQLFQMYLPTYLLFDAPTKLLLYSAAWLQ